MTDLLTGDHTTTSATGTVSLWFLRAGGSLVEVRKLGYEPWRSPVDPRDSLPLTVALKHVVELAPVESRARPEIDKDPGLREEFDLRRQAANVSCVQDSSWRRTRGNGNASEPTPDLACARMAESACIGSEFSDIPSSIFVLPVQICCLPDVSSTGIHHPC